MPAVEIERVLAEGRLPNLVGWDLDQLGDGTGLLFVLHEKIGVQVTRSVASDTAAPGEIVAQRPAPGTPLEEIHGAWLLEVSDGGPLIRFEDLPDEVATFASQLAGFDPSEPLIARSTVTGIVYKSDRWLFSLDCAAVDVAYRTFLDGSYEMACGYAEN